MSSFFSYSVDRSTDGLAVVLLGGRLGSVSPSRMLGRVLLGVRSDIEAGRGVAVKLPGHVFSLRVQLAYDGRDSGALLSLLWHLPGGYASMVWHPVRVSFAALDAGAAGVRMPRALGALVAELGRRGVAL